MLKLLTIAQARNTVITSDDRALDLRGRLPNSVYLKTFYYWAVFSLTYVRYPLEQSTLVSRQLGEFFRQHLFRFQIFALLWLLPGVVSCASIISRASHVRMVGLVWISSYISSKRNTAVGNRYERSEDL